MFNWISSLFKPKQPKKKFVQTPPPSYTRPRSQPAVTRQAFKLPTRCAETKLVISPIATDQLSPHSPHRNSVWDTATESAPSTHPSMNDGDDPLRSASHSYTDTSTSHSNSYDEGLYTSSSSDDGSCDGGGVD